MMFRRIKMERITKKTLWKKLISYVSECTNDVTSTLNARIIRIGFYDEIKDQKDSGLRETCEILSGQIIDLYERLIEIKNSCMFIEDEENKND